MIVLPFLFHSMPSNHLFCLYHTSIEPESNEDKDNAVGWALIRRGRSVLMFLVTRWVIVSGQLCSFFADSISSNRLFFFYHTSIQPALDLDEENAVGWTLVQRGWSVLAFWVTRWVIVSCQLFSFFADSILSNRLFWLYHTSIGQAWNVDEEFAVGWA